MQDLEKITSSNPEIINLSQYMKQALMAQSVLDIGLCHGDLVPSNLCHSRQKIYFLDWELSKRGPVIHDIMRLAVRYPHKAGHIVDNIRQSLVNQNLMRNGSLGFAYAMAMNIIHSSAKRTALIKLWQKHYRQWL